MENNTKPTKEMSDEIENFKQLQKSKHYVQTEIAQAAAEDTVDLVKGCCSSLKLIAYGVAFIACMIVCAAGGGLYVYKVGPSFLGLVPEIYGNESYKQLMENESAVLKENLGLVESHSALEAALARAIEGMDRHADGEVEWQGRALKAERKVKLGEGDKAMKQFAFALAHDSVRALERGAETFPLAAWNEAFRGGFVDTIVGCGHTRCIKWMKNHPHFDEFSDNEKELLAGTKKLPVANEKVEEIESKLEVLLELVKTQQARGIQTGQGSQ